MLGVSDRTIALNPPKYGDQGMVKRKYKCKDTLGVSLIQVWFWLANLCLGMLIWQ